MVVGGFVPPVKKGKQEGVINRSFKRQTRERQGACVSKTQEAGILREIPRRSFLKVGSSEVLSVSRLPDAKGEAF